MNRFGKVLFIAFLLIFINLASFGSGIQQQDTLRVKTRTNESVGNANNQGQGSNNRQSSNAAKNNPSQSIKQVKGARPDMSKARGARPPSIVRPSGSGVPRGIGKPGGAGKKPGR